MKFDSLQEAMQYVANTIYNEGFDYTFCHYSDFKEIENEEFQKLRQSYLRARNDLTQYIYNTKEE